MVTIERESATVEIPNSSPHSGLTDALESVLLQQLEELEPQEQRVLCELLKRTKRDRSVNGYIDELAIVVNGLKSYTTEGEDLLPSKRNEKIAPDLHKEFVNAKKFQLEAKFPPITEPISEVINRRFSVRDFKRSGPLS